MDCFHVRAQCVHTEVCVNIPTRILAHEYSHSLMKREGHWLFAHLFLKGRKTIISFLLVKVVAWYSVTSRSRKISKIGIFHYCVKLLSKHGDTPPPKKNNKNNSSWSPWENFELFHCSRFHQHQDPERGCLGAFQWPGDGDAAHGAGGLHPTGRGVLPHEAQRAQTTVAPSHVERNRKFL